MYKEWRSGFGNFELENEDYYEKQLIFQLRYFDGRFVTAYDLHDVKEDYELKFIRREDAFRVCKNLQKEHIDAGINVPVIQILWYSVNIKKIIRIETIA